MSLVSQRDERRNVRASTTATLLSAPITPISARPSCGFRGGAVEDASSSWPCAPALQVASMRGSSASQRARSSTATHPSKAAATSRRSRQPIQRDKGSSRPKLPSIRPESSAAESAPSGLKPLGSSWKVEWMEAGAGVASPDERMSMMDDTAPALPADDQDQALLAGCSTAASARLETLSFL